MRYQFSYKEGLKPVYKRFEVFSFASFFALLMNKSQLTYTKEFKQQAVQLIETSGKSKTQIARDLGVSDSYLARGQAEMHAFTVFLTQQFSISTNQSEETRETDPSTL